MHMAAPQRQPPTFLGRRAANEARQAPAHADLALDRLQLLACTALGTWPCEAAHNSPAQRGAALPDPLTDVGQLASDQVARVDEGV